MILLEALVDDAGLFPPERLALAPAIERHRRDEARAHPVLTHRFLCPASVVPRLSAALDEAPLRLGLIADTGPEGLDPALRAVAADPRLVLETIEVALPAEGLGGAAVDRLPQPEARLFCELPRAPGWREALERIAQRGLGAKIRCGGLSAELFPTTDELGAFVHACAALAVPFKATAGLHNAVRHRDPATGFDHHGFLNLLIAAVRAARGAPVGEVVAALATADGAALAAEARGVDEEDARGARRLLVAYGSCSTSEPLEDLAALGLVEEVAS